MLLFCCPKPYKSRYYGQKEMMFVRGEALHVCMSHIGIPASNHSQKVPMPEEALITDARALLSLQLQEQVSNLIGHEKKWILWHTELFKIWKTLSF